MYSIGCEPPLPLAREVGDNGSRGRSIRPCGGRGADEPGLEVHPAPGRAVAPWELRRDGAARSRFANRIGAPCWAGGRASFSGARSSWRVTSRRSSPSGPHGRGAAGGDPRRHAALPPRGAAPAGPLPRLPLLVRAAAALAVPRRPVHRRPRGQPVSRHGWPAAEPWLQCARSHLRLVRGSGAPVRTATVCLLPVNWFTSRVWSTQRKL